MLMLFRGDCTVTEQPRQTDLVHMVVYDSSQLKANMETKYHQCFANSLRSIELFCANPLVKLDALIAVWASPFDKTCVSP